MSFSWPFVLGITITNANRYTLTNPHFVPVSVWQESAAGVAGWPRMPRCALNSNKNSSGDEIANVNFYAVRAESYRSRWNNAITPFKVIQGHRFWYQSKAHIRLVINTNLPPILLVINTNLPPILHCFRDIAVDRSEIAIFGYPLLCLTPPAEGFPWNDLREIFSGCQRMARVPNAVEKLPKSWTAWVGCTSVTDDRQTDRRQTDGRQ